MKALVDHRPVLRSGAIAFARVFRELRVLVFLATVFFGIALVFVVPVYAELREILDRLPSARGPFGSMLLDEVRRVHPGLEARLGAFGIAALLLWSFFASGCCAISRGPSMRLGDYLATCGRFFFRSFRTMLVFLALLSVWSWVSLRLLLPLVEDAIVGEGGDEAAMFRFEVLENGLYAIGVLVLLALRRLALARIVLEDRSSALRAYVSAASFALLHPIRTSLGFLVVLIITWIGLVSCAFAGASVDASLVIGGIVSLLLLLVVQSGNAASFAVARLLIETQNSVLQKDLPDAELPRVELKDPLRLG